MKKSLVMLSALLLSCAVLAQAPSTDSAPAPATGAEPASPEPKSLEDIFECLAAGLPQDWRSASVEVIELATDGKERQFEARYTLTRASEPKPQRLEPCDSIAPAKGVHEFNQFLEPEKRQWKRALLIFRSDGKFELKYDYAE